MFTTTTLEARELEPRDGFTLRAYSSPDLDASLDDYDAEALTDADRADYRADHWSHVVVTVTASLAGLELGSASIGGVVDGHIGGRSVDGLAEALDYYGDGLADDAITDARALLARITEATASPAEQLGRHLTTIVDNTTTTKGETMTNTTTTKGETMTNTTDATTIVETITTAADGYADHIANLEHGDDVDAANDTAEREAILAALRELPAALDVVLDAARAWRDELTTYIIPSLAECDAECDADSSGQREAVDAIDAAVAALTPSRRGERAQGEQVFGACGEADCRDCLPSFDAANNELAEYRVEWTIDVEASSSLEAARAARAAQVRPGTTAVVFDVTDASGETVSVDLDDVDDAEPSRFVVYVDSHRGACSHTVDALDADAARADALAECNASDAVVRETYRVELDADGRAAFTLDAGQ